MSRTYVIAECGSCHDGDLGKAKQLAYMAEAAGADCVKFQYWSDPNELADRRRVPEHYRDIYRRYAVPRQWLRELAELCATSWQVDFMCSTYLPQDVAVLAPLVRHFKVSSFESGAWDLLRAHEPFMRADIAAGRERWLIVSQGMGANWNACGLFSGEDNPGDGGQSDPGPLVARNGRMVSLLLQRVKFLHCTSAYPAPVESLRLARISDCEYGMELDGFSDHSDPALTWTGALAVAAGAEIVEAHLRLDDTDPANPDAPHAMTPRQFDSYVRHVRFAEACLGTNGGGAAHPVEAEMAQYKVEGK